MASRAFSRRFADHIQWVPFANTSGMDIPPFSCVSGNQWKFPNIGGGAGTQSPLMQGTQPTDPINPYELYITGASTVKAGGRGACAQPLQRPQLIQLSLLSGSNYGNPIVGETCGPWTQNYPFTATLDAPAFIIVGYPPDMQGYAFVLTYTCLYRGNLPLGAATTTGLVQVTTFVEPAGTPSAVTYPVCNPYGNVNTAQAGINPRCTYGWVGGRWEIVSADPCADTFAPCPSQNRYGS
jgi:hypothetical protein